MKRKLFNSTNEHLSSECNFYHRIGVTPHTCLIAIYGLIDIICGYANK